MKKQPQPKITSDKLSSTQTILPLIVCPTSHNDWDWQFTFEGYYERGWNSIGVKGIWDCVTSIFASSDSAAQDFRWNYAEIAFLRQYLNDSEHLQQQGRTREQVIDILKSAGERFCLLGGGITSPDNQVCNGEVFIRNYLTGHEFLTSIGLEEHIFPVAWLPDDFGHNPQMPALIEAMGLKAIALSRVPGSPQPKLRTGSGTTDYELSEKGLSFFWPASDGSKVFTNFMPVTYYGLTHFNNNTDPIGEIVQFLQDYPNVNWPNDILCLTQGGDWQFPYCNNPTYCNDQSNTSGYNWTKLVNAQPIPFNDSQSVQPQLGTFADYYHLMTKAGNATPSTVLFAENYYTGYFASRPKLKLDHYQATRQLIAAEVLGSLFLAYSPQRTSPAFEALLEKIDQGWELLVPTSHHDFVTGTSPDGTYLDGTPVPNGPTPTPPPANAKTWDSTGQVKMSNKIIALAQEALDSGMDLFAAQLSSQTEEGIIPVLVFNQLGMDLPDTALVEMKDPSNATSDYKVLLGDQTKPVQRIIKDGISYLLFQVPGMRSMQYKIINLQSAPLTSTPLLPPSVSTDVHLSNDVVSIDLSFVNSWAISQLTFLEQKQIYLADNCFANKLEIWEDQGNLYQFGMEYTGPGNSMNPQPGIFQPSTSKKLQATQGQVLENGPVRWRFLGHIEDDQKNKYSTQYDLVAGENLVRIQTIGSAPFGSDTAEGGTSVIASFELQNAEAQFGTKLEYGTAYHWENRDPRPYWPGLTFRASHNFASLVTTDVDDNIIPIASVYHNGIPAWTLDQNTLRGCLLRNTPGGHRAASGTDSQTHTLNYTLEVGPQLGSAKTGYPLRQSLYTQTPLHTIAPTGNSNVFPEQAQLASIEQSDAVIQVARPKKASPAPFSNNRIINFRIQQTSNESKELAIDLPFYEKWNIYTTQIVTALEKTYEGAPIVSWRGNRCTFQANRALWTMQSIFIDF